jgi:hypothetical protein
VCRVSDDDELLMQVLMQYKLVAVYVMPCGAALGRCCFVLLFVLADPIMLTANLEQTSG